MSFLNSLKAMFKKSIPDLVIKYNSIATQYETVESKRDGDRYVSAKMKTDTFGSYLYFTESSLLAAGFTPAEAKEYAKDKTKIPENRRQFALEAQREEIIKNYVEQNDYYRMLAGLPSIDEQEEVWLEKEIYDEYGIEPCAIHEVSRDMLCVFESIGLLEEQIKLHPDAIYLQFLGKKNIDPSVSRSAGNYQILYFPRLDAGEIYYKDFMLAYEQCREYFLTVIYNQYYTGKYIYYDNYLAFSILIMTINKLIPLMLQRYIEREFYDVDTVRIFLESYGIEYNRIFTLEQLKLIAKNLNLLLQSKSSNLAFVDLLSLIGYSNFNIMKYYMIKQHKVDDEGRPIFEYKTEKDEEGNEIKVPDYTKMFSYYFLRTDIQTYDIQEAIRKSSNKLNYRDDITTDDYWVEDTELVTKLANAKFNYIETKYMDLDVMYKMHSILFETIYLTRMVLDKSETKAIYVTLPSITASRVSLFDVFILLICLLCKYYHIEPEIMKSPSKILHILGYNFKADFEKIKEEIRKNRNLDDSLCEYIKTTTFTTPGDVNKMFVNVRELEKLLVKLMNETHDHETYSAYRKLYETLLWEELNEEIYKLPDGKVPDTFSEYLQKKSNGLYNYYLTKETTEDICFAIDYVTSKLTNMFTDTKYLNYIKVMDTANLDAIVKLLCFFKSYTVMMRDANLVIIFDSRFYNMAHFSEYLNFSGNGPTKLYISDSSMYNMYTDAIEYMLGNLTTKEKIKGIEHLNFLVDAIAKLNVDVDFRLFAKADMKCFMELSAADILTNLQANTSLEEKTKLIDAYFIKHRLQPDEELPISDDINFSAEELITKYMEVFDLLSNTYQTIKTDDSVRLGMWYNMYYTFNFLTNSVFRDKVKKELDKIRITKDVNLFDVFLLKNLLTPKDSITIFHKPSMSHEISMEDDAILEYDVKLEPKIQVNDTLEPNEKPVTEIHSVTRDNLSIKESIKFIWES